MYTSVCVLDSDTLGIMQNLYLMVPIQFLKTNLSMNCAEKKYPNLDHNQKYVTGLLTEIILRGMK